MLVLVLSLRDKSINIGIVLIVLLADVVGDESLIIASNSVGTHTNIRWLSSVMLCCKW